MGALTEVNLQDNFFTVVRQIKESLQNSGFTQIDLGLKQTTKETLASGSYTFLSQGNYRLFLQEPFYQDNQTRRSTIQFEPQELTDGVPSVFYSQQLTAIGGTAPYTFHIISTNQEFNEKYTIVASDSQTTISRNFLIPIRQTRGDLEIITVDLATADSEEHYSFNLYGGGGTGNYTWSLALYPSWLQIEPTTGKLFGQVPPNSRGLAYLISVELVDGLTSVEKTFTLEIKAASAQKLEFVTPITLPPAVVGLPYVQIIQVRGGNGPVQLASGTKHPWLVFDSTTHRLSGVVERRAQELQALPGGMDLTSGGLFFGTPRTRALTSFNVQVTDATNLFQEQFYSWLVTGDATSSVRFLSPTILPLALIDTDYQYALEATGGAPPYSFKIPTNSFLPPGISLSSAGILSGKPQLFSTPLQIHQPYNPFVVTITDSKGNARQKQFVLTISSKTVKEITVQETPSSNQIFQNDLKILTPYRVRRYSPYSEIILTELTFTLKLEFSGVTSKVTLLMIKPPKDLYIDKNLSQTITTLADFKLGEFSVTTEEELYQNIGTLLNNLIQLLNLQQVP